jgi:trehalose-6-phosphate synthase
MLASFPEVTLGFLLDISYPFPKLPSCDPEQRKLIESLYQVRE